MTSEVGLRLTITRNQLFHKMPARMLHFLSTLQRPLPLQSSRYLRNNFSMTRHVLLTRHPSTGAPKPRVLEKPTKFNPPSHGRRLRERVTRHYGPELTQQQKLEQGTKQYPNMMPPKGTFMHWFLTNRSIHLWITMVLSSSPVLFHPQLTTHFPRERSLSLQRLRVGKTGVVRQSSGTAYQQKKTFFAILSIAFGNFGQRGRFMNTTAARYSMQKEKWASMMLRKEQVIEKHMVEARTRAWNSGRLLRKNMAKVWLMRQQAG